MKPVISQQGTREEPEMGQPIHILHLEDDPADAELVRAKLDEVGLTYQITRVQSRAGFEDAIRQGGYDLILADYQLPMYDGLSALRLTQELCPDVPFIFISGTMGEDVAIEALIQGATDYVLKQKLSRLGPSIRRALLDADNQRERAAAEAARAKLEEQLRQVQKLESIGQLAGGVAHDFNNLLTVIRGHTDLIQLKMPADDPQIESLEQIRRAVTRASDMTRQLLALSRQQIMTPTTLDLNELVTNLNRMLGRLIGEDISLTTVLRPGLRPVLADPGQIEQVIMNLILNARDAMPSGGRLTIETSNVELEPGSGQPDPEAPTGSCVMLTVTDTGHGIDDDVRTRIFEPFFTTKDSGKGTGLGLATAYGIVKQSGGHIAVESEPGTGTTMQVYLPASELPAKEPPAPHPHHVATRRGHETIMLVEDDAAVCQLVQLSLQGQGYTILEAHSGRAALSLVDEHQGEIDLVLTDVVMPNMSGRELVEQLKARHPHVKVIFMSGYTSDIMVRHGVEAAEIEFLPKPFSPSKLATKVREVLDG